MLAVVVVVGVLVGGDDGNFEASPTSKIAIFVVRWTDERTDGRDLLWRCVVASKKR